MCINDQQDNYVHCPLCLTVEVDLGELGGQVLRRVVVRWVVQRVLG